MIGYQLKSALTVICCGGAAGATLAAGFALARLRPGALTRTLAWALALGAVAAAFWFTRAEPDGVRMLAVITLLFCAMKALIGAEARIGGEPALPFSRWLCFVGWVGMRPWVFESRSRPDYATARRYAAQGALFMALGLALVFASHGIWRATRSYAWPTPTLLVGLSLMLHFGFLKLLAGVWQAAGFADARPLFRAPLASRTLGEFWSRRWNLAFSEMVQLAAYRPLVGRAGPTAAALAGFLLSGLLHEVAISGPVRAGYGGPITYFVLHGVLVLLERRSKPLARALASRPWLGRAWTLGWLALPLPILFHPPFLRGVIWPLAGIY